MDRPLDVAKEFWDQTKLSAGIEPGMPHSALLWGNTTLKEEFKEHTCLHRAFKMEAELHRLLHAGNGEQALAQCCQNLRALSTCLQQKGVWKGAWEYTYLPDVKEKSNGATIQEKSSMARFLRERAAIEKIVEEARTAK